MSRTVKKRQGLVVMMMVERKVLRSLQLLLLRS